MRPLRAVVGIEGAIYCYLQNVEDSVMAIWPVVVDQVGYPIEPELEWIMADYWSETHVSS